MVESLIRSALRGARLMRTRCSRCPPSVLAVGIGLTPSCSRRRHGVVQAMHFATPTGRARVPGFRRRWCAVSTSFRLSRNGCDDGVFSDRSDSSKRSLGSDGGRAPWRFIRDGKLLRSWLTPISAVGSTASRPRRRGRVAVVASRRGAAVRRRPRSSGAYPINNQTVTSRRRADFQRRGTRSSRFCFDLERVRRRATASPPRTTRRHWYQVLARLAPASRSGRRARRCASSRRAWPNPIRRSTRGATSASSRSTKCACTRRSTASCAAEASRWPLSQRWSCCSPAATSATYCSRRCPRRDRGASVLIDGLHCVSSDRGAAALDARCFSGLAVAAGSLRSCRRSRCGALAVCRHAERRF